MEKQILKLKSKISPYKLLNKLWFPLILLIAIVVLFSMYQRQHKLYQQTREVNRQLSAEINHLQDQNERIKKRVRNIQRQKAASKLLHPTFIDQQKYYRLNWKNYIHLSLNDYKTGLLGGIKNIKVTVANTTDYKLDEVAVKLSYYRANSKLFKTETVLIQDISPQKSNSIAAPNSRRGMSVQTQFIRITSREMNFCWQKDKRVTPGEQDPYRCAGKGGI